jgi:hypothetical protein
LGGLAATLIGSMATGALAQETKAEIDNGTNPTRLSRSAILNYEHVDLFDGYTSEAIKLSYSQPFGKRRDYSIQFKLPITSVDSRGDDAFGLGDGSIQLVHVFGVTRERGFVAKGELIFDSASRDELGSGQNVFKGTFIYAKFLANGNIFAPSWVQTVGVWGLDDRPRANITTLDFYYVPKFKVKRYLMTLDPSLSYDWESEREFAGLAVTLGRVLGSAFGGNAIVTVKPQLTFGPERPFEWAVEVTFKLIGF